MEAFTLLKYWRGGGGLGLAPSSDTSTSRVLNDAATTTAVPQNENENENVTESDDDDDDDGPFFDLEFTVPDEVDDSEDGHENPNASHSQEREEEEESDSEREFKFTLSPSSNDRSDPNLSLSPSDDLFFKGKLVQVDPSSFSEPNSKPQFTASLLKSATKFRVFMLGLKKSKSSDRDSNGSDSVAANPHQPESHKKQAEKKLFTVKFKVEEVPIMSLFSRDSSSSSRGNKTQSQSQNQKQNSEESPSEEKRFSKEVMHKYLKMVKPLYIRVSRRYGDKLGQLSSSSGGKAAEREEASGEANLKSQKLPAGFRVVCKHLGKSRSASSAVAAAPSPFVSSKRRDDSLLQQQDGIQGAILHCKRSFNASTECESSQLPRSVSDPSYHISSQLSRKSIHQHKDKRL